MRIEQSGSAGIVVAAIRTTRIDAASANAFKAGFADVLATGSPKIVLDLTDVTFIDSTGLGAIVGLLRQPGPSRSIAIAGAGGQVQVVFRLTKMNKVFQMFATRAEALAALAS